MRRFIIALFISILYLILGNLVGMQSPFEKYPFSDLLEVLFVPYTFIAGLSSFAGWDGLSFLLEAIVFVITIPFFYSMLMITRHIWNKRFFLSEYRRVSRKK